MASRTHLRILTGLGLAAAAWGAWHAGYGFVVRRLAMPEVPADGPSLPSVRLGRVSGRVAWPPGHSSPLPTTARLRLLATGSDSEPRFAVVDERGRLEMDLVPPGRYALDVAAGPGFRSWEVVVEAGKTTDLGVLTLPGP